ncbi:MAG TPA: L,D-transpeptidase family protein [Pyrinomonadaceae bacterium]|nr:L,D-transpeptidase family protein [Pyrinomonadaceae bacterium]
MRTIRNTAIGLTLALSTLAVACAIEPATNTNSITAGSPAPSASRSPAAVTNAAPLPLPVLDALFSDEAFKTKLKSKLELTDDQLGALQKIAGDEVARLRQSNIEEQSADQLSQAEQSRAHAAEAIQGVIGQQKAENLFAFVHDYWIAGPENKDSTTGTGAEKLPTAPNSVPTDTRVVVNIPAFRMDVFKEGSLVKSYKIGIGYPEFPLPTGLRKAQTIIFNPTWTPPDEPWVAKMKNVSVGEKVAAGSKLNPLGPIKIPIGLPSLIHGGKSPAKLGTFASHGCVGLTTPQVQDFSKLLAQVAGSEISEASIKSYFADKTKTRVVKLSQSIPVELRYETIVLEEGKLHIYRDVYDQDSNTEEGLRAVLEANGVKLEDLDEGERTQILEALNAMSRHPSKGPLPPSTATKPAADNSTATTSPSPEGAKVANKKATTPGRKPIGKNQKEVVIELAELKGKGYPAALNLDTGSGKPATVHSSDLVGPRASRPQ